MLATSTDGKHSSRKRIIGALLVPISAWSLWQIQESILKRWESQVIFNVSRDSNANLVLQNLGDVDVEDIKIYGTIYRFKISPDKNNHIPLALSDFSKIGGTLTKIATLQAGTTQKISLTNFNKILPFFNTSDIENDSNLQHGTFSQGKYTVLLFPNEIQQPPLHEAFNEAYCFRVTLRNSITKRRYSYYLVTSPFKDAPFSSIIDASEDTAVGGPFDMHFFELRANIRKHQAELFDEADDHLYQDKDVR